jgi:hypothetical protein
MAIPPFVIRTGVIRRVIRLKAEVNAKYFERRCETMKFIECMIEKVIDLAGSDALATVLIKISSLYKYASLFV